MEALRSRLEERLYRLAWNSIGCVTTAYKWRRPQKQAATLIYLFDFQLQPVFSSLLFSSVHRSSPPWWSTANRIFFANVRAYSWRFCLHFTINRSRWQLTNGGHWDHVNNSHFPSRWRSRRLWSIFGKIKDCSLSFFCASGLLGRPHFLISFFIPPRTRKKSELIIFCSKETVFMPLALYVQFLVTVSW